MADCHDHDHHPHDDPQSGRDQFSDPASQSLSDALKVSFRLLTLIMVGVVVAFLLTGIKTVESNEVGIKTRFGKVVGLARQGLAYTWPYPVGDIEIIPVEEQEVVINDFAVLRMPGQESLRLDELQPRARGLDPAIEGALLTGDHSLLHTQFKCKYTIGDPLAYRQNVGKSGQRPDALNSPIRSAVAKAAITAAAHYTADSLQRTDREKFAAEVRLGAQNELELLGTGIKLTQVLLTDETTWPLRTRQLYVDAQNAITEAEQERNRARAAAENILNDAAGPAYKELVGDPTRIQAAALDLGDPQRVQSTVGLIGLYRLQRQSNDPQAEQTLREIDKVLLKPTTGGQASRIISEAHAVSTATVERAKGRALRFNVLLAEYEKAPQLMLERLWAQVRDDILSNPQVEKFYLTLGPEKTVVRINRSPEIIRELEQEQVREAAAKRRQKFIDADR